MTYRVRTLDGTTRYHDIRIHWEATVDSTELEALAIQASKNKHREAKSGPLKLRAIRVERSVEP
jgi:hypothetical protein